MTRCPAESKEIGKGTAPGSAFTTGEGESWPNRPTPNTSMSLPLAFVVTISFEPSGEKATWPGVLMNWAWRSDSGPRTDSRPGAATA